MTTLVATSTPSYAELLGGLAETIAAERSMEPTEQAALALDRMGRAYKKRHWKNWQDALELAEFDRQQLWALYTNADDEPFGSLSEFLEADLYGIFDMGVTKGCTLANVYAFYVGDYTITSPRPWLDGRLGLAIRDSQLWQALLQGDFARLGALRRPIVEERVSIEEALEMADRQTHPDEVYKKWLKDLRAEDTPGVDYKPPVFRNLVYDDQLLERIHSALAAAGIQPGQTFKLVIKGEK